MTEAGSRGHLVSHYVEQKLITAILPIEADGIGLVRRLKEEHGIITANVHYGRGIGRITSERHRTIGDVLQKEILTVSVDVSDAERIFAWLYEEADIDRPHGGILFMQPLRRATLYELPDLPEEGGPGSDDG